MRHVPVCLVLVTLCASPAEAQLPTQFTNLQVLPKDVPPRQLLDTMKGFTQGLSVRCEFCHAGEGNDLSKFDFAADTKATKATARKMMRVLSVVNDQLSGVGNAMAAGPKVTCFTCHRGTTTPATAPDGRGAGAGSRSPIR